MTGGQVEINPKLKDMREILISAKASCQTFQPKSWTFLFLHSHFLKATNVSYQTSIHTKEPNCSAALDTINK
jgi:hypothetical protein